MTGIMTEPVRRGPARRMPGLSDAERPGASPLTRLRRPTRRCLDTREAGAPDVPARIDGGRGA